MFGRGQNPLRQLSGNVQRALDFQARQIRELQQHAIRQQQEYAKEAMDSHHQGAMHYAQVIMLAGYAGFFTLWTQSRGEMTLWLFSSTGALISISLITFVGFELLKSWRMGRAAHPTQANAEAEAVNKYWPLAFLISSITGVVAGASILFWYVYKTIISAGALLGAA